MNQGFDYRSVVPAEAAGRTLLHHLALRYTHTSREDWSARVLAGEVHLDGRTAGPDARLRAGQSLVWRRPPWQEPAVPLAFAVLLRDAHLLAVAKPRGLPTVPAGGFLTHTLLHLVRALVPGATPAHRLGRGTSGIVLFALSPSARSALARDLREGRVEKTYRALVTGSPREDAFTVDAAIGRVPHPRLGHVHAAAPHGRHAVSHVRVLARRGESSLVDVTIPTGRPHQIRIHLAAAGHPLVGDPLYGSGGVPLADPALPGEGGYWLHAAPPALHAPGDGRAYDGGVPSTSAAPRRALNANSASALQMKTKAPAWARRKGSP